MTTRVCLDLLETNVAKVGIRDVSDEDPPDFEDTLPLVRRPHGAASRVVNLSGRHHHEGIMKCWNVRYPPALTSPPSRRSDRCRNDSVRPMGGCM